MVVGVLGLQGSVKEIVDMINRGGDTSVIVKEPEDLEGVSLLIIPGGESTTISKLLVIKGLDKAIIKKVNRGMAVWGICAGLILLANFFNLLSIRVERNSYGSQLNSFEGKVKLNGEECSVKFIRAPKIVKIDSNVIVLAIKQQQIVGVRQNKVFGTSFHTETSHDLGFYEYVKDQIRN